MYRRLATLGLVLALPGGVAPARAQSITIDGRLSPAQTLAGPNYTIGANLGQQRGGNLFHSFGRFSIGAAESATFTGPANVTNVIGRVTGGSPSAIAGQLSSTIQGANVMLINPAGIAVLPGARIDVPGAFRVSTADEVRFADGARFRATNPDASTLTHAPPAAFGFLGAAQPITITGATINATGIGVAGGAVTISGATLSAPGGTVRIAATAGAGEVPVARGTAPTTVTAWAPVRIDNGAVVSTTDPAGGNAGRVRIRGGAVTVSNASVRADTVGAGTAGKVRIRGESLLVDQGATITANSHGAGTAGTVAIRLSGAMDVVGNGADYTYVAADGWDAGAAGRVRIRAGSLGLSGYSYISADGVGDGAAGQVDIRLAGSLSVHSDAPFAYTGISATAYGNGGAGRVGIVAGENVSIRATGWRSYAAIAADSYGTGDSGLVEITAGNQVRAAGSAAAGAFAQYIATTNDAGSGAGGTVRIRAHGLELFEQGDVVASNFGSGAGTGTIDIALTGDLVIDGGATAARISSIAAENAHGPAGRIRVEAGNIILRDGGRIEGNTSGAADSASVELIVRGTLSTSDRPWDPNVDFYPSGVTLDSFDFATGNVGRITVRARNMELRAGGLSASTHALGLAGTIDVEVQERMLLDMGGLNGGIGASTFRASGDGGGGLVRIRAGELVLRNGAEIQASTTQAGNGGNIDIAVRGTMVMEQPQGAFYNTIISTQTNSWGDGVPTGNAGRVSIQASDLLMRDGAQITSSTRTSNGNAGGVSVNVSGTLDISGTSAGLIEGLGRQMALYRSGIFSDASAIDRFNPPGAGSAGEVNVNAGSLRLSGGGAIATSTAGIGSAGNVRVSAPTISIGAGSEIASSTSAAGRGGNVVVSGGDVSLAGSGARIAASSGGSGAAGTVNVAASTISLGAGGAIESSSTGAGRGGSVAVTGGEVRLAGAGARIAASSTGSGDAGDILVVARALMLRDGATIATNARIADGGNIRILVPRSTEMIRLDNASITASVGGGGGSGGNIFIDPAFLVLRNSVISADAFGGAGGNITIQTNFLLASPTSRISASSALGVQGAVLVNTTQFDPAGSLATLTSDLLAPPAVLREACAARAGTAQASLVVGTPGGLPFSPEAMLPATYLAGRTLDATAGPVLAETGLVTQPIGQARQAARCG